jgi:amino acid transporter
MMGFMYLFGATYWLIPYTILVIALWVWSQKKTKTQISKGFMWSPFLFAILMVVFSVLASLVTGLTELYPLEINFCIFPLSIVLGYVFISAIVWIHDFLKSRNVIVDDEEAIIPTEGN